MCESYKRFEELFSNEEFLEILEKMAIKLKGQEWNMETTTKALIEIEAEYKKEKEAKRVNK